MKQAVTHWVDASRASAELIPETLEGLSGAVECLGDHYSNDGAATPQLLHSMTAVALP